jgi:hypothetical protein
MGASPSRLADGHVSDVVLLGNDPDLGARAAPMPSTFRDSAVAVEAEEVIPKSRTG